MPLTSEEDALLDRLARKVVELRLTVPAIFMLESVKPLSFVGSQAMLFFAPVAHALADAKLFDEIQRVLEKREAIEALIVKIEGLS